MYCILYSSYRVGFESRFLAKIKILFGQQILVEKLLAEDRLFNSQKIELNIANVTRVYKNFFRFALLPIRNKVNYYQSSPSSQSIILGTKFNFISTRVIFLRIINSKQEFEKSLFVLF